MSPSSRAHSARRMLDRLIEDAARLLGDSREPFWRLLRSVRAHSQLLPPSSVPNGSRWHFDLVLRACVRLAEHDYLWVRPPETWTPHSRSPFEQFRSLVSHLLARYPVPNCMAWVWMYHQLETWELPLYQHLGAGYSVRQFEFPVPFRLSKRGATWFMQAPDDLIPLHALRWAHVRSLGGDNRLARLLATRTVLGNLTTAEPFWETVIRFLIRHDPICQDEIVAIVRFIDQQRFQPAATLLGERYGQGPIQPDFSLEGRSLMSLRRHMANWRTEIQIAPTPYVPRPATWARTSINPFRAYKDEQFWSIDELLTSHEIHEEAHFMKHCVATYLGACIRRRTSIWSMKVRKGERTHRLLTIEVIPNSKLIYQASGKCNAAPCPPAWEVLQEWALQEGLKLWTDQ